MSQLLLELFSEEIPARMQKRGEEDLAKLLGEKLAAHGLKPEKIATFSSPRRLGAVIENLPAKAADVNEEKKGPRVGAPEQAVQGFLKSAGLASLDQAEIVQDKKGDFYVARIERAGRETSAILGEIIPEIIRAFPWPKSMRSQSSDLTWVRPLHNILCLFDGKPVAVKVEGVGNEAKTWGHRFHAPGAIAVKDAGDHYAKLREAKVLIDRDARRAIILEQAKKICAERKLELVEDAGLLEEVTGLVEWPVVLMGAMDSSFLDLPGEVIRLTMRTHQKYFAVRNPQNGKLAPHFITVANIEAKDGGDAIAAGNARVLSARLNDARFFWDGDKKTPLYTDERKAKLEKIVFHQKLGSVWDKVERVKALAVELCAVTGADPKLVERAADRCKMDLVTETVGEFPELQGQIGRELFRGESGLYVGSPNAFENQVKSPETLAQSQSAQEAIIVADDIQDHYKPLGPGDGLPRYTSGVTLALADKLDTLACFWAINEKPTGSADPYALRRSALGFIRILLEAKVRIALARPVMFAGRYAMAGALKAMVSMLEQKRTPLALALELGADGAMPEFIDVTKQSMNVLTTSFDSIVPQKWEVERCQSILAFLADRLKVQLRDQGKRHDLVDAVFAPNPTTREVDDDLVRIVARVEALDAFLKTEDGANLLAGYKRAANILAAEEKKGRLSAADLEGGVDAGKLIEPQEKALASALDAALGSARASVEKEDFAAAMKALAPLRAPVDAFFDKVLVNAQDNALRLNRLKLLARLREALSAVADFSKVEG